MSNLRLDRLFNFIKKETQNSGTKTLLRTLSLDTICIELEFNSLEAGLLLKKLIEDKHILLADKFGFETMEDCYYVNPVFSNFKGYIDLEEQKEREKQQLNKKTWYETENAKQQFEDYSRTKKIATIACTVSIAVLLFEILKWIIEINQSK